jgi:P4 family phage/plasmid primase-like protien
MKSVKCTGNSVDNLSLPSLDLLYTESDKDNSPVWNFTTTVDRKEGAKKVNGFIVDYDSTVFPDDINTRLLFFYHKTHNDRYRIIVPFSDNHEFTTTTDYIKNYEKMLDVLFFQAKSIKYLYEENILQSSCNHPNRWFYLRPKHNELYCNKGNDFFKPEFVKNFTYGKNENYSYEMELKERYDRSAPTKENSELNVEMLNKVNRFYNTYNTILDWTPLKQFATEKKCFFDWHDDKDGFAINDMKIEKGYVSTLYCYHSTCVKKTNEFLSLFLSEEYKPTIYNYDKTVKYLAALIIQGKISLKLLEACGFYNNKKMMSCRKNLKYLSMNAERDANLWIKIYHESIVLNPFDQNIYEYVDDLYQKYPEPSLLNDYQVSIGLYFHYKVDKSSERYVKSILYYSKGHMQNSYSKLERPDSLSLKNGILIFKNGKWGFHDHSYKYFITNKMNYNYDNGATCPLWLKTLEEYFGENAIQIDLLQEFFGYCLSYDRSLEKLLILYGVSRGGKNTIIQTLMQLFPSTEGDMQELTCIERRSTMLCDSKVVFFNEVNQLSSNEIVDNLKKISSTDNISVRYLKADSFILKDVPKIIIAFNNPPENMKIDRGLKNRMLSIKFTRSFEGKENINLKSELTEELPGILNWALKGYEKIYKNKGFSQHTIDSERLFSLANQATSDIFDFLTRMRSECNTWNGIALKNKAISDGIIEPKTSSTSFYRILSNFGAERSQGRGGINIIIPDKLNKLGC